MTDLWNSTCFYSENHQCIMLTNTLKNYRFSQFVHMWHHISASENFLSKIFRNNFPPKKWGTKLVTVTNQPVTKPPPIFYAYSQAKVFLSSTGWKYRRLPIWQKFVNLEHYINIRKAGKWYALVKRVWAKTQENKNLSAQNERKQYQFFHRILNSYIISFCLQNSNPEIRLPNFSWFYSAR